MPNRLIRRLNRHVIREHKKAGIVFDTIEDKVNSILASNRPRVKALYYSFLDNLELDDNKNIKGNSKNTLLVENLSLSIKDTSAEAKQQISRVLLDTRIDVIESALDGFNNLTDIYAKAGLMEAVSGGTGLLTNDAELLNIAFTQRLKAIASSFVKWEDYAYRTLMNGVLAGSNVEAVRSLLFTDTGNIKIGSSLEQEVNFEAAQAITEQRTNATRAAGKQLGLTYAFNFNPMDGLTKPECISATTAGCIPLDEMEDAYGFPPRWICRCDLVVTDPAWGGLNTSINKAIDQRRTEMLDIIKELPKRKDGLPYRYDITRIDLLLSRRVPDYMTTKGGVIANKEIQANIAAGERFDEFGNLIVGG
jgi:hypothetical protein